MLDKETIQKVIEAGNRAPSGGNSQPWKFVVENNAVIKVVALPEKDHPVLNFRNRGTHVAHGALLENMEIAANSFGYKPYIELVPQSDYFAKLTFETIPEKQNVGLAISINQRHTNRKPFHANSLNESDKDYIFSETDKFPNCELHTVENEKIRKIAESTAMDMVVFLQNPLLHKLLFKEILWDEEEQKIRGGLYVKTLEATPPKALALKLLKNWGVAKFFNKAKITDKIYAENVRTGSSAGIIVAIAVENKDINFVEAGRFMENIWLKASQRDLGFHLMSGISFLWQQANFGKQEIFSEKEKKLINQAYENLISTFGINNKIIALMFRIGKSEQPMAKSHKRPPEIIWK